LTHECMNDCVLFWKEHAGKDKCPKCKVAVRKFLKKSCGIFQ